MHICVGNNYFVYISESSYNNSSGFCWDDVTRFVLISRENESPGRVAM